MSWCGLFSQLRLSRVALLFLLLLALVLLMQRYLPDQETLGGGGDSPSSSLVGGVDRSADAARKTLGLVDFTHLSGPELKHRIEEMLRIKQSVQTELMDLEGKRKEMQAQVAAFHRKIEELRVEATREQAEMERLRASISQAKLAQQEYAERNTPEVHRPLSLESSFGSSPKVPAAAASHVCTMADCFDYSRCPLTAGFRVYVYDYLDGLSDDKDLVTPDPNLACLFVVLSREDLDLASLPYWNGDGRNHLLVDLAGHTAPKSHQSKALVASPQSELLQFRPHFDLTLPHAPDMSSNEVWALTAAMLPVHRKYLLSFQGVHSSPDDLEVEILRGLLEINSDKTDDRVAIELSCNGSSLAAAGLREWSLCGSEESRQALLRQSTFAIILAPKDGIISTPVLQSRLYESLRAGAIPVIVGATHVQLSLPFSEVVDWTRTVICQPLARVTELHFLLRSFTDADLFAMQRQGNLVWKSYLASSRHVLRTAVHVVRERLDLPPPVMRDAPSPSVFINASDQVFMEQLPPDMEPSEPLGPLEQSKPSVPFRRNFSSTILDWDRRWNSNFDPFFLSPYSPWETLLPTDAKFLGSSSGFRPIGEGSGGAGKEFSQALGGNSPAEQFTVVILTYEREEVLIDSLVRLFGLPFLNKVVVVWNTEAPPSPDLRWPDIGVPVEVIRTEKNSLNNRFLPFDAIETEAVLSVDDDAHLRHDEIVFGFRVWRENRDRLVGFPGRFHAWDLDHDAWNYNSNYSCELSMVLTGAAFYHKYYSYVYTHLMPQAVRDKVDEYTNCEDLAMNFLISHMTRKPPVKVTSRWTFRCPGCPVVLSEDDSHFQERHKCINFFSQVFGYMPLLYTQYRADSVLFKTRIPQDKQKCFRFI